MLLPLMYTIRAVAYRVEIPLLYTKPAKCQLATEYTTYGMATMSRIDKVIGRLCRISSLL